MENKRILVENLQFCEYFNKSHNILYDIVKTISSFHRIYARLERKKIEQPSERSERGCSIFGEFTNHAEMCYNKLEHRGLFINALPL